MKRAEHKHVGAAQFFFKNAGYSYTPGKETPDEGRRRCADTLATAEASASAQGFYFRWSVDPSCDFREFSKARPAWKLWQCCMYNAAGEIVNSLHAIDFGRSGEPWGQAYRRVVEAELAVDGLTNAPQ